MRFKAKVPADWGDDGQEGSCDETEDGSRPDYEKETAAQIVQAFAEVGDVISTADAIIAWQLLSHDYDAGFLVCGGYSHEGLRRAISMFIEQEPGDG